MKKFVAIILAIALMISAVPIASALNYNGFVYTDNGDGTCIITSYRLFGTDISIPGEINGLTVTAIADGAFKWKNSIETVTMASSITSIGALAFSDCTNLFSVSIGAGVLTIGDAAFSGCKSLTGVNVRNAESIGKRCFQNCTELINFNSGSSLKSIGENAFYNDKKLNYVKFSDTLETIGDSAFEGCEALTSLTFPDSLQHIGTSAFRGCIGVETITFGTGELVIGGYAFEQCTLLTEVTIPETVTAIGNMAFAFREPDSTAFTHTVKIICHLGSAGVTYSIVNNAPVYIIELDREISSFGDIDGDGSVTTKDARKALRLSSGIETTEAGTERTEEMLLMGDLNQNGVFDLYDTNLILSRAAGI